MTGWSAQVSELAALEPGARDALERLRPMEVARGTVLFSPGEPVQGYVFVLEGAVAVELTGPNGREMLLYEVEPGKSCIQSTLGLLSDVDYSAEARVTEAARLVLVPRPVFHELLDRSPAFRKVVFSAFAERMQNMMQLIENVSFMRVEERLAQLLLERAEAGVVHMTQADMARAIGTAREVVTRRLDKLAKSGVLQLGRGTVEISDPATLEALRVGPAI